MAFSIPLISDIQKFLNTGHIRTQKAKKNIIGSLFIRGLSIISSFIFFPVALNFIGKLEYGIWLTFYSIIGWLGFFDIGLGHGLRNRFAEALAKGDHLLARKYVSTTYAGLLIIVGFILLIFPFINPFIPWDKIVNAPPYLYHQISVLVIVVLGFFMLRFVSGLIGVVLAADQRQAISSSFDPVSNIISLIIILICTKITSGSLLLLGTTLTAVPVVVYILSSIYFFRKDYKIYSPSLRYVDFRYFKDLAGLGVKFFIINIAVVVIFFTDNIIINQLFGPETVTTYNVAYKYFSIIAMVFSIIVTPLWSAYTEAYIRKDFTWIRMTVNKLLQLWYIVIAGVIIMVLLANTFYHIWVGDKVTVPFELTVIMGVFTILNTWCSIWSYFINGTGKIKISLFLAVVQSIINIPLSIFFAKALHIGPGGVIMGTSVSLLITGLITPIQYRKIINNTDQDTIWGK